MLKWLVTAACALFFLAGSARGAEVPNRIVTRGFNGDVYVHGVFNRLDEINWVEENSQMGQGKLHFKMIEQNKDQMMLYDASREMTLRFDFVKKNLAWRLDGQAKWNRLYDIVSVESGGVLSNAKPTAPSATVGAGSEEAGRSGRRVALVIGNSSYRYNPKLANPVQDANLVAAALTGDGLDVTVVHDLGRDAMVAALKDFSSKADSSDWAVIYYAGHGIEVDGKNYLVPVDAKLKADRDVQFETVSLDSVMSALSGARKLKLVVLDACRNNPFAQQMKRTVGTRSVNRGLSRVEPIGATLVVYAAKDGTTASDGSGTNSPFAESFARRIDEPGLEINKVLRFVRQDVLDATANQQEPFVYGSLPPTDFYFAPLQ